MPFKTQPDVTNRIATALGNLPRRLLDRPLHPPSPDPEICTAAYRDAIVDAFNKTDSLITEIKLLGGECLKLGTCLDGWTSEDKIYITCANCKSPGWASATVSPPTMQLCLSKFAEENLVLNQGTVDGLVFLQLIYMCGGRGLDAYGLLYYFFYSHVDPISGQRVFTSPNSVVKGLMCAGSTLNPTTGYRFGTFTVWQPMYGTFYPKQIMSGVPGPKYPSLTGSSNSGWAYMCP
jgi:hypothetical protein